MFSSHGRVHPLQLRIASFTLATALSFFIAIETELVIEQRFKGETTAFFFFLEIVFHFLSLFCFSQRPNAKPDLSLIGVDINDLCFDLVAHFIKTRRFIDPLCAQLRNVDQAFYAFFDADKNTEVWNTGYLALYFRSHR